MDKDYGVIVEPENVINEILPFAAQGVDGRDVLSQADYARDVQRTIGHQPGIARQELANKQARQAAHVTAGLAQFLARRYTPGVVDDGDLDKIEEALVQALVGLTFDSMFMCEIFDTHFPDLMPGFEPAQGGLLQVGVAEKYPAAWAFLQSERGRKRCCTEAEWQQKSVATWHTLADGTKVGFNGIGGVDYFVQDLNAGTLRLPDWRGMHREGIGGPGSPSMAEAVGDGIRDFAGHAGFGGSAGDFQVPIDYAGGAFYRDGYDPNIGVPASYRATGDYISLRISPSRVVPTSPVNRPRSVGVLPCVYLGTPR